jgi:hypothetical protein
MVKPVQVAEVDVKQVKDRTVINTSVNSPGMGDKSTSAAGGWMDSAGRRRAIPARNTHGES